VAVAVDHHVVELDTVRAFEVARRPRRLLQPFRAHRLAREILIAVDLDDVVAVGDHVALQDAFMPGSPNEAIMDEYARCRARKHAPGI